MRSLLLAVVFAALSSAAWSGPVQCRPNTAVLSRSDGAVAATFRVELADDEGERSQGLMRRESMPRSAGMLFIYPSERPVAFWMRDTLIPLDMLFIDGTGRVVAVHPRARPLDETPIPSGVPVQFVLEINGGLAERLGLTPGVVLSHPAIAADRAARPCR
ncbi:DUF192 domain-containing protein [Paenirhodobacter sp.]|uniref:DUF192 domain-containing protein n=1 Tax=Paenirhodobacter sp. TaxID=1965326 RepID=UPI003B400AF8